MIKYPARLDALELTAVKANGSRHIKLWRDQWSPDNSQTVSQTPLSSFVVPPPVNPNVYRI